MDWSTPTEVTDIELSFPARGLQLTPDFSDIGDTDPAWTKLADDLFFGHGADVALYPRDGTHAETAWRHLQVVLRCYAHKHQRKIAGAAWLLSLWYEAAIWTRTDQPRQAGDPDICAALWGEAATYREESS